MKNLDQNGLVLVKLYEPKRASIKFQAKDLRSRVSVFDIRGDRKGQGQKEQSPNVIAEAWLEPIRNPVTGKVHRAIIEIPEAFESSRMEQASTKTLVANDNNLSFRHEGTYGSFSENTWKGNTRRYFMGRWEDEYGGTFGEGGGFPKKSRNWIRIGKFVILGGFIVVTTVILSVFIPRAGLSIEIIERGGIVGSTSIKVNNNNFNTLNDVTVQFGEQGKIQNIGDMGPFSSVFANPEAGESNFDKIIVKANNGEIESVRFR